MQRVDVLVVGAGPGGAAAAKQCVEGGLKTLLIDRHKLPRRKACSGIRQTPLWELVTGTSRMRKDCWATN